MNERDNRERNEGEKDEREREPREDEREHSSVDKYPRTTYEYGNHVHICA